MELRCQEGQVHNIYTEWMTNEGVAERLVFIDVIDDSGFTMWPVRNQGRAAKGCRMVRMVERQRGKSLNHMPRRFSAMQIRSSLFRARKND